MPDFPLHRVISLEVTEIKCSVLQSPPSTPHFLFTEKPGAGSNPPAPQIALMSASEGDKNHRPPPQRPAPGHPCGVHPELEVQSQDDLIYRKDKDVV